MKIPVYDQQVVPNQGMATSRITPDTKGTGIAQIGEGLQNLAIALNNRQKVKAQAWFTQASSQADLDLNQILNEQQKTTQPGAEGFGKTYLEAFDKYKSQAVANAPAHAKPLMEAHLAKTREAYGLHAMRYETEEGNRYMGQQFDEGVSASSKLVSATPELFEREMGKFASTAAQMATDPQTRAALNETARKNLAWNAVTGEIDRNPGADSFTGKAWDLLTADEQDRAQTYAKQKKNEFKTQKQANLFIGVSQEVINTAPLLPGDNIDLAAAEAKGLKIFKQNGVTLDAEQQLQYRAQLEHVRSNRLADIKVKRDIAKATGFAKLDKYGGDLQRLYAEHPELSNQPQEVKDALNKYAGVVASGGTREVDWVAYTALINDPALLKKTNVDSLRDKFTDNQANDLIRIQTQLNKGLPEQNLLSDSALAKRLAVEAGYANDADHGKIFSLVQSAINQERVTTGKEVSQKRVEELTKEAVYKKVKEDNFLWFDKKMPSAYDLLKDADPDDLAQVDAKLKERGEELSDINRARMLKDIQDSQ